MRRVGGHRRRPWLAPAFLAVLAFGAPVLHASATDCLSGHTKRAKDGSTHVVFHHDNGDVDEPIASARCTPMGRIVVRTEGYYAPPEDVPDSVLVINPASGRTLFGTYIFDVLSFSPDNRLVVYASWNGAHGSMSILTTLYLLDADGAGDPDIIRLYPSKSDLPSAEEKSGEFGEWIEKPQPDDIVWLGPRKLAIVLFDVDEPTLSRSREPISVALVSVRTAEGKPPVAIRKILPPPPCLIDLYARTDGGDTSHEQAACLAKSLGQHP
jgi:hypothetical protein